jgi:hypothetical protein
MASARSRQCFGSFSRLLVMRAARFGQVTSDKRQQLPKPLLIHPVETRPLGLAAATREKLPDGQDWFLPQAPLQA